jgi:type I restriction enzyme S subunit
MPIEFRRDGSWELPAGWVWARLGDVCQINQPPSFDNLRDDLEIPFVPMSAVAEENGRVDLSQRRRVSELRSGYTRFQSGDVLFAKITPCMENGKIIALPEIPGGYGAGSTEFHTLRSQALEPRYLWYWLVRKIFRDEAQRSMRGAVGQLRVPTDYLRDAQIAIPPLPEQRRIVERIDELFTEITDGETALERALDALNIWRRALLKAVVTGELTSEWRQSNSSAESGIDLIESARAACAGRVKVPRRVRLVPPSDEIRLPPIPQNWAWGQLGDFLYNIEAGVNVKAEGRPPQDGETGIVKISAVTWDEFDEDESKTLPHAFQIDERNVIRRGDFLISRANTLELVAAPVIVKSCKRRLVLSDKVLRLRLVRGFERWIELCLKSPLGRQQIEFYASGNQLSMRNITQENIARLAIPIPPRAELQYALSAYAENSVSGEEGRLALEGACRIAKSLRQSTLKSTFCGQLVRSDPNDEPVELMLTRLSNRIKVSDEVGKAGPAWRTLLPAE